MTTSMISSPFQAPADQGPRTARLEILERHAGPERYGQDYPLKVNTLRVNGRPLWATQDDPIVVHEIRVDGRLGVPLVVVVRLHSRSLAIGAENEPEGVKDRTLLGNRFAVLRVPGLIDEPGAVAAPYVLVDGIKLLLGGEVVTQNIEIGVPAGDTGSVLTVDVPLLCRSVVFDDEVTDKDSVPQ